MPAITLDDVINASEAAQLLGIDRSVLTRYSTAGKLTPVKKFPGTTGAYLFLRTDVLALAAERRADLQAALDRIGAS